MSYLSLSNTVRVCQSRRPSIDPDRIARSHLSLPRRAIHAHLLNLIKYAIRQLMALSLPQGATLPIMFGQAKGLRATREIAIAYPALMLGHYELGVTKAIQSIKRPINVAYDIGAHVGLMSLVLSNAFGGKTKVLAFEPARSNLLSLSSLIAANPAQLISVVPIALSDRTGTTDFCHFKGSSMGLLHDVAIEDHAAVSEGDREIVEMTTLDGFIFTDGNPPPDLIKIDVEGAEHLVLAGGLQTLNSYRPVLLVELHGPIHAAAVYDLLSELPYSWTYIKPYVGPEQSISNRAHLLSYFGRDSKWTQHVLLQWSS
jgi:FkbM family methyltransferase